MKKSKKAFTLIELTVGMAVIAVLITLGIVGIGIVQTNARDVERGNAIASLSNILNDYRKQNLSFPKQVDVRFSSDQVSIVGFKNFPLKGFLKYSSDSTTNSQTRFYYKDVSNSDYQLCVLLESGSVKNSGTSTCPVSTAWN